MCADSLLFPWLPGSLPPVQYERMHAVLKRLAGDTNGMILLRAYATWAGVHEQTPDIVWRTPGGAAGPRGAPSAGRQGAGWLVDLDYLEHASVPDALKELADRYKDATRVHLDDPYASLGAAHPLCAIDPAVEQAWHAWTAAGRDDAQRHARTRAVLALRRCVIEMRCYGGLDRGMFLDLLATLAKARAQTQPVRMSLDLSYLGVDSIPPIAGVAPCIDAVNLSGNPLGDWRNMPISLRSLELRSHRGAWPEDSALPADLAQLDLSHCDLAAAPAAFLDGLRSLAHLVTLTLRDANLDALPDLAGSIRSLDIGGNRFRRIPANLPPGLTFLHAARNPLEALPESMEGLPAGLRCLFLRSDSTAHLRVPDALRRNLNLYIDLEPTAARMSMPLEIRLRGMVHFLLRAGADGAASGTLRHREAAARWSTLCRELAEASGRRLEVAAFHTFLQRLSEAPAYLKHAAFRLDVRQWMIELASRPRLRDATLGACREANETCGDRVVAAFNRLMIHRLNSDIEDGVLDGDIARVLDIARQVFSLEVLAGLAARLVHEIRCNSVQAVAALAARPRTASLPGAPGPSDGGVIDGAIGSAIGGAIGGATDEAAGGHDLAGDGGSPDAGLFAPLERELGELQELEHRIDNASRRDFVLDELEIHLALPCLVRDAGALDLWAVAPEGAYVDTAGIDPERVRPMAIAEVRRRGEHEFMAFLVLDYEPWAGLMKRRAGDAYARAEARLYERLEASYEAEVVAALRPLGLDAAAGRA